MKKNRGKFVPALITSQDGMRYVSVEDTARCFNLSVPRFRDRLRELADNNKELVIKFHCDKTLLTLRQKGIFDNYEGCKNMLSYIASELRCNNLGLLVDKINKQVFDDYASYYRETQHYSPFNSISEPKLTDEILTYQESVRSEQTEAVWGAVKSDDLFGKIDVELIEKFSQFVENDFEYVYILAVDYKSLIDIPAHFLELNNWIKNDDLKLQVRKPTWLPLEAAAYCSGLNWVHVQKNYSFEPDVAKMKEMEFPNLVAFISNYQHFQSLAPNGESPAFFIDKLLSAGQNVYPVTLSELEKHLSAEVRYNRLSAQELELNYPYLTQDCDLENFGKFKDVELKDILSSEHPYYSSKLASAIQGWLCIYNGGCDVSRQTRKDIKKTLETSGWKYSDDVAKVVQADCHNKAGRPADI